MGRLGSAHSVKPTALPEQSRSPSWLVSFVVHMALLLLLALIPTGRFVSGPLTLILGGESAAGLAEFELMGPTDIQSETLDTSDLPELAEVTPSEVLSVDLAQLIPKSPPVVTSDITTQALVNLPFGLANGLSGRTGRNKQAFLERNGGSTATEEAVELGLRWLAKQQKSDGSWSLVGPYSDGAVNENTTAATAMALNAFLGAGYTNRPDEKYSDVIRLGLAYLLRKQDQDGFFAKREPSRQQMYAQALASITVIEAYGLTGDSKLRMHASRAVKFAEWSQSKLRGWRYEPQFDADMSVTGWYVMVLETAKMVGLQVDEQKLQDVSQFLDSVSHDEQSRYAYNRLEPPSLSMTAEALLCRIMLGWSRTQPPLMKAIREDLLPGRPSTRAVGASSVYFWYYATQVLHHVGGESWNEWNEAMKVVFPGSQIKDGPEAGSWDPMHDIYASAGGRLYTTALHLYCLEVYYRHLSVYDLGD
jgi:hypothetical protein